MNLRERCQTVFKAGYQFGQTSRSQFGRENESLKKQYTSTLSSNS